MNLSLNDQFSLFASFSSYLKAASWPTYGRTPPLIEEILRRLKELNYYMPALLIPKGMRLRHGNRTSMSCEAALKSEKKYIKNQNLII